MHVYEAVKLSVDIGCGQRFFVYGHGGTGKTYLWNTIISGIRSTGKIVLAVASSGIVSLLLPGSRIAHSRFKIPLDVTDSSTCQIKKGTQLAKLIQSTSLIVWDEAPMVLRNCFEVLDKSLKDVLGCQITDEVNKPFGGLTVVLGGDFRQILPVVRSGSRADIVNATINQSELWQHCKIFRLKTNMRLTRNNLDEASKVDLQTFAQWLLDIGDGKIQAVGHQDEDEATWIKIPTDLLVESADHPIHAITATVYSDFEQLSMLQFQITKIQESDKIKITIPDWYWQNI